MAARTKQTASDGTGLVDEWETPTEPMHAHFDCFSGAAGDMMLAACLDVAKDDRDRLMNHVAQCIGKGMPELQDEFTISCKRVWRGMGSITATHVTVQSRYNHEAAPVPTRAVITKEDEQRAEKDGHDHSHSHDSHAQSQTHDHSHAHKHEHEHEHSHAHQVSEPAAKPPKQVDGSHSHQHDGHAHSHGHSSTKGPLRNLPDIRKMLQDAPSEWIPVWVRDTAIEVFTALAQAEATVHGAESMDAVHFHEVGAVDSIVDTVGTLLALYFLGVKTVSCSRLPLGEGSVNTDHGILPVPAPATLSLMAGMPVTPGPPGPTGELVTPTAAALLRVLTANGGKMHMAGQPPLFTLRRVGVGAGTKDFHKHPNILRLLMGDTLRVITRPSQPETSL
jgi:uncharacterized protein (DUF111 family)